MFSFPVNKLNYQHLDISPGWFIDSLTSCNCSTRMHPELFNEENPCNIQHFHVLFNDYVSYLTNLFKDAPYVVQRRHSVSRSTRTSSLLFNICSTSGKADRFALLFNEDTPCRAKCSFFTSRRVISTQNPITSERRLLCYSIKKCLIQFQAVPTLIKGQRQATTSSWSSTTTIGYTSLPQ